MGDFLVKNSTKYPKKEYETSGGSIFDSIRTAKAVVFGQTDFQPAQKELFKKYGHLVIISANIVRTSVESAIVKAMKIISKNKFQKNLDKAPFDQLYHLQLDVKLSNNTKILLEKIEVVNIEIGKTKKDKMESEEIDQIPEGITLSQFVESGKKRMGKNFFPYDSKSNNCQDFILNMLMASNMGTSEDYTFVKQDTDQLFKKTGKLGNIANALTDIGAKGNLLMKGGDIYNRKYNI